MLLLKVPLEQPGMCKMSVESKTNVIDRNSSDVYIGLITLFLVLMQGHEYNVSSLVDCIPFDVVSLQQVVINDELALLVAVVENQNTYRFKGKRTKSSNLFQHAISVYLNTNTLEEVLCKIWERIQDQVDKCRQFRNFWDRLQYQSTPRYNMIPGHGRLSSYISVSPDQQAVARLFSLKPKLYVHSDDKLCKLLTPNSLWFSPSLNDSEYTCLTLDGLLMMSPRIIYSFLTYLRDESIEICGLRIGFKPNGEYLSQHIP